MTMNETRPNTNALDQEAHELMQSALALIPGGAWRDAARALEAAAMLHARAGRAYDEARCLQLAATLARSSGDAGDAGRLAARAASVAPEDRPLEVSIAAEIAEIASGEGRQSDAVDAWTVALETGRDAGLGADAATAVLLRRAAALLALGRLEPAADDYREAFRLLDDGPDAGRAPFVAVEHARLLLEHGHAAHAEREIEALEARVGTEPADAHLLAETHVLRARLARAAGEIDRAVDFALRSREAALLAVAPVAYFAASVELAEALQTRDDRTGAYGALAAAWATLSDLLGGEVARSWVEPCLVARRIEWGRDGFEDARRRYEARRRSETHV